MIITISHPPQVIMSDKTITLADAYQIFIKSKPSKTSQPSLQLYSSAVDKLFCAVFPDELHRTKWSRLKRAHEKKRHSTPKSRESLLEDEADFYTVDMSTKELFVELSDDEGDEAEESPAPKKCRQHILKLSKSQQHRRLDSQYSNIKETAGLEDITVIQLLAMHLFRASYSKNKEVADFAERLITDQPLHIVKEISVPSASLLLSTLEIGKSSYKKLRGILKSEVGDHVVPCYDAVASHNKKITPNAEPLSPPYSGVKYPLIPAITMTCQRQLSTLALDFSQDKLAEVTFKAGFDGSGGHSIFNQKGSAATNNIIMAMICPISIRFGGDIVWTQPLPQSQNTHRFVCLYEITK